MPEISNTANIELRQLRQFIAVAEELHFRRAAARLGMAQPPLSQAIQKLERDVGTELFDRQPRQVRLTEAGSAFLEEARKTLAQAGRAVAAAQRAARGTDGFLRITYVGAALYDFLPRLLKAFRQAYPALEIELRERTTTAQVRALQLGEADVGLIRPPVFNAGTLRHEPVLREPLVVAFPEDHPLAKKRTLHLQDLAQEGFVMFPPEEGPSFHARVLAACEEAGFGLRVVQEAVQMHAIVSLVAARLGIALVPASMEKLRQPGVAYRSLATTPAALQVDLAVMWRGGETSSAVHAFLDFLRDRSP